MATGVLASANLAVKNRLRPFKHAIWPTLGRLKRLSRGGVLRARYFAFGLPDLAVLARDGGGERTPRRRFAGGMVSAYSRTATRWWNITHYRRTVIVVLNGDDLAEGADAWFARTRRSLGAAVLVHRTSGTDALPGLTHPATFTTEPTSHFRREILRFFPGHDVVLIDAHEPFPAVDELVALKHAAYSYPHHHRIGAVAPSRRDADGKLRSGVAFDRTTRRWVPDDASEVRDYGQSLIPRYVLSDQAHSLYLKHSFIEQITFDAHDHTPWDELCASWIASAWKVGVRTLLYSPATVLTRSLVVPPQSIADNWLVERSVVAADGRVRVIFVLPATSISGGIRAVLEMSDGLSKKDLDVEIWALEGQPTWTEIALKVVQFPNYETLLDALSNERAIKVATWWETGQIVWLASVNNGIPLQYVQEFETWFYPDDPIAQAAVVSSYRREFVYTTIAKYQQEELREIGIFAEHIPSAFDDRVFKLRPDILRRDDTVLALGRSFFQKNFALTLAAWQSLGDDRPRLALFGIEPGIAVDPRISYSFRPDDEQVAGLYSEATCFVQTSLHEGFCLPLIEAMASGCPVITTDSHGNDFCVDGVNCIIVEQGDQEGVADAIRRLMDDPALRDELRMAALETAKEYAWPKVLAQTKSFYAQVASEFEAATSDADAAAR